MGQRRVVEEAQGTPQSVQDREPPSSVPVTTSQAVLGTVRRLELVQSQQREPMSVSPTVPASRVLGFQNRFDALREPEQIVDEEQGRVHGEAGEPFAMETVPDHDEVRRFDISSDTASIQSVEGSSGGGRVSCKWG